MNIGIYVYELAEELDWAGPWEVLAAWSDRADDLHEPAREVRRYIQYDPEPPV
jgi:hypothetical protein